MKKGDKASTSNILAGRALLVKMLKEDKDKEALFNVAF